MVIEWVPVFKDVVTAIVALGGLWIAWLGLDAWRRQLTGRTEYELARRLLRATYAVRDEIEVVRSPFVSGHEMDVAALDADYAPEGMLDRKPYIMALAARVRGLNERLSELRVEALEAEVLWGSPARQASDSLFEAARDVNHAIMAHIRDEDGEGPKTAGYVERLQKAFKRTGGVNSLGHAVDDAVKAVEALVRPHIGVQPKRGLRRLLPGE